jgi:hypothetical protein
MLQQDQHTTTTETAPSSAPSSTYYPATRILPSSSRAEVTRYKFPELAETVKFVLLSYTTPVTTY